MATTSTPALYSHPVQLRCPVCDAALLGDVGDDAFGPHLWCPRFYCGFMECIGPHDWTGLHFTVASNVYAAHQCRDCGQPFHGPLVPPWLFPTYDDAPAPEGLPSYTQRLREHDCDDELCCAF